VYSSTAGSSALRAFVAGGFGFGKVDGVVCSFPPVMGSSAVPATFTATATTLALYQDLSGGVVVEQVFTKR
jgi:hypothetical protein